MKFRLDNILTTITKNLKPTLPISQLIQINFKQDLRKLNSKLRQRISREQLYRFFNYRNLQHSLTSLSAKATILILVVCTLPVMLIGWYLSNQTIESLTQAAIDKNNKVADRIAGDLAQTLLNKNNFLMATSGKDEIRALDAIRAVTFLRQIQPYYGGNDALFLADYTGRQIARTDQAAPVSIADREYFKLAMQGKTNYSDPVKSKVTGQLTILGVTPVFGIDNKIIGVLGANISLKNIHTSIEKILAENPGYAVTVLDKNCVPLYHQFQSSAVEEQRSLADKGFQQAVKTQNGALLMNVRGQDYFMSYRPVPNTEWVVAVMFPKAEALKTAREAVDQSVLLILALVFIMAAAGLICVRFALQPLKKLADGAVTVASGDLTYQLPDDRKDEIGKVAAAFANMTGSLRKIVQGLKTSVGEISSASSQVAAAAGQASAASRQVTQSIQEIDAQAAKQEQDAELTGQVLQELVQTSSTVADNSGQVVAAAKVCTTAAITGEKVIAENSRRNAKYQEICRAGCTANNVIAN